MKRVFITIFALLALKQAEGKSVGKLLKLCKPKDADFQECFKKSVEASFTILKDGDRSLGFVPIDPLDVPYMEIMQPSGPVGMNLKFMNCKHYGLSNLKVIESNAMPEKYRFEFKVHIPYYTVAGPYEADGRILLLPVTGKGWSNVTMFDQTANWTIQGKPKKIGGKTFMEIESYILDIKPKSAYFELANLFNGDKQLGDATHNLINDNNQDVIAEIGPSLNKAIGQLHGALAQRIFDKLPYEEAFPGL